MKIARFIVPVALAILCAIPRPAEAQRACDRSSFIDAVGATPATEFVAGVAGQRVYVCGVVLTSTGNAAGFRLVSGTGTNCGTDTANVTQLYQLPSGGSLVNRIAFVGPPTPLDHALCATVVGAGTINATVYWTQF